MNGPRVRAELSLLLGGDVMLGRLVNRVIHDKGTDYPFDALLPLREQADLFFVNLECAITSRALRFSGAEKAFYFRADPEAIDVLRHAGVDMVALANNHALDADLEGLRDTLLLLEQAGIPASGAGVDASDAHAMRVVEASGMRIGVIALCDHQPDFAATGTRAGIAYSDLTDSAARDALVARTRMAAREVDHLVVSLHWLSNWVLRVPEHARELARRLCDADARIVWGHSPHHILGCEWIGRSIVIYSSGDLIDDYAVDPYFRNDRQLLYRVQLSEKGVEEVRGYPLHLRVGRTEPADEGDAAWIRSWTARACSAVGSSAAVRPDGELDILPGEKAHA